MLGRIEAIEAAGEYGNSSRRKTGAVRRRVDAARQSGSNGKSRFAESLRQPLRNLRARR
jgi:hypothetical protein